MTALQSGLWSDQLTARVHQPVEGWARAGTVKPYRFTCTMQQTTICYDPCPVTNINLKLHCDVD